ncbi:MAG: c-type cytochrome [Pseudomonadota bacterium]
MRRLTLLALGGVLLAGGALAEGDPEAGRRLAGQCRTCHGLDGYAKIPIAPHIGGESAAYIAAQLRAFRDGTRRHEMMSVVAAPLSDRQIADLAAWYSAHEAKATLAADPAEAPQACAICHGADGIATAKDAPNLAGETNIYIENQLKAFSRGKRTHEAMSVIAEDMTDAEMRAAADWYAAVELEIEMAE